MKLKGRRFRMGLTFRIIAFTFLLAAVPLILIAVFSFRAGSSGIQKHTEAHLRSIVIVKAQEVERWFRPLEAATQVLASNPNVITEVALLAENSSDSRLVPEEFDVILGETIRTRIGLSAIAVVSKDLKEVLISSDPELSIDSFSITPAVGQQSSVSLNLPPYSRIEENPQATVSAPIVSNGQTIAYLVIFASPYPLYETLIPDAGLGPDSKMYLVDRTGTVLSPPQVVPKEPDVYLTSDVVGLAGDTNISSLEYTDFTGTRVVAAYNNLDKLGLGIVAELPVSLAFNDIARMRGTIAAASTIFFFLTLAAATFVSRRITRPVKELAFGARAVGKGDLTHRIKVSSQDELGFLAQSFNTMAGALDVAQKQMVEAERATALQLFTEQKVRQLRHLNELGVLIAEEISLEGLVQLVPDEAKIVSGADFAVLIIFDESLKKVEYLEHTRTDNPHLAQAIQSLREENGFRFLAEGRSVNYCTNGTDDNVSGMWPEIAGYFESVLLVPLRAEGSSTAGAIMLGNTSEHSGFSQEDQELMQIVSDYTSSALQKIRKEHRLQQSETRALDALEELKSTQEQLVQAQKMESIGKLAGGVAHDFNNLLTPILAYSEIGVAKLQPGDRLRSNFEEIHKAGERASNLVGQLLAFSRRQIIEPRMVDLNKVIVDMEKMLHRLIGEDIELVALPDPDLRMVKVDPGQMDQLLINLGVNARDAMPSGGKLTVETSNFYLDENYALAHPEVSPGSYVMLAVSDSGTGMTEDVKARIFEPFFTTKGPGKGTGLGLSTCYGIVKQNGGNISVYSEPGSGTTFKVYLPVLEDEIYPETESAVAGSLPGGTETIFLVEDERAVQEIASIILREQGYKVMEASNGIEALEMVKSGIVGKIDLLLADVVMPVMGGKELANQLTSMHPEIKVLFTSGYTDDAIVRQGVLEPGTNFIQKPLTRKTLTTRVREVLDSRKMPV